MFPLKFVNKYTITLALIAALGLWFTFYVSSKEKKAIGDYINEQIVVISKLLTGDQNAVNEQDNIIGNDSIIDGLFPDIDSNYRQDSSQGDSHEAPHANPIIKDRFKTDSGNGVKVELPFPSLLEPSSENTAYPNILRCTNAMMADCSTFPECCNITYHR